MLLVFIYLFILFICVNEGTMTYLVVKILRTFIYKVLFYFYFFEISSDPMLSFLFSQCFLVGICVAGNVFLI